MCTMVEYFIVDAFTDHPYSGNPAGVVLLKSPREGAWMQAVAREVNLSETAFVGPLDADHGRRGLRWFTPTAEVDLCGHATLAAAFVLGGRSTFMTRSGELHGNASPSGTVEVDLPADAPATSSDDVSRCLPGVVVHEVLRGTSDVVAVVDDADVVGALRPDIAEIVALGSRGLIVTAPAREGDSVDYVARCFYPAVGVPEDPVTGSAHCTLAGYWGGRLGRRMVVGAQLSARGGIVRSTSSGARVVIAGDAVMVMHGRILH